MRILSMEAGFTSLINIGRYALFIEIGEAGTDISFNEVYERAQHYNYIVVDGEQPLIEKSEIGKLFRKLVANNENVQLVLHARGIIRPVEVAGYSQNILFIVRPFPKEHSSYKINEKSIEWFTTFGAYYLFEINKKEDFDTANFWVSTFGIKKSKVFLMPNTTKFDIPKYAQGYSYNLAPEVDWE